MEGVGWEGGEVEGKGSGEEGRWRVYGEGGDGWGGMFRESWNEMTHLKILESILLVSCQKILQQTLLLFQAVEKIKPVPEHDSLD